MLLFELFQDPPLEMNSEMRNMILDVLTPLVAQKVPFVTVDQIIDKLREFRTGIAIDRGFIMNILDPENVKVVQKIEGDRIYLNIGGAPNRAVDNHDAEKEQEQMHKQATAQAQKNVTNEPKTQQQAKSAGGAL